MCVWCSQSLDHTHRTSVIPGCGSGALPRGFEGICAERSLRTSYLLISEGAERFPPRFWVSKCNAALDGRAEITLEERRPRERGSRTQRSWEELQRRPWKSTWTHTHAHAHRLDRDQPCSALHSRASPPHNRVFEKLWTPSLKPFRLDSGQSGGSQILYTCEDLMHPPAPPPELTPTP